MRYPSLLSRFPGPTFFPAAMGMARAHKRELRGPLLAAPGLRVVTLDEHAHALLTSGRRPAVRLG